MDITPTMLARFVVLTREAVYDYGKKEEYRKLGRKILKYIAKELGLTSYTIRWNPGGPAISGDHTLHTDKFDLHLEDNCGLGWFYWRTVTSQKDFHGGPNRIVYWNDLKSNGLQWLIGELKKVQNP